MFLLMLDYIHNIVQEICVVLFCYYSMVTYNISYFLGSQGPHSKRTLLNSVMNML
jgi:hypothetical protein